MNVKEQMEKYKRKFRFIPIIMSFTNTGNANDSGYFALLASGSHPRHILPR